MRRDGQRRQRREHRDGRETPEHGSAPLSWLPFAG
jgi:hypothetical protein